MDSSSVTPEGSVRNPSGFQRPGVHTPKEGWHHRVGFSGSDGPGAGGPMGMRGLLFRLQILQETPAPARRVAVRPGECFADLNERKTRLAAHIKEWKSVISGVANVQLCDTDLSN